jgi:ribosomal protein L29
MIAGSAVSDSSAAALSGVGMLSAGNVRAAAQELRDSSREELQRLLDLYLRDRAQVAVAEILAAHAETAGKPSLARVIRAGFKFGIMTIIAAVISGPVSHEEGRLMHWTPPPITVVRQMSPAQMDELSHQILRELEKVKQRHERR